MISLHFIVDFCPQERLDRGLLYLKRTRQPTVNIAGGAQLDRTMQFIERVRAELPNIVIQWRLLEDTGIMIKLDPNAWFNRYIAPRLDWLKRNKIVIVVDNETSGSDDIIKLYVDRSCLVADLLHTVQLNGVFCRFATGTINDGTQGKSNQYPLLKKLLDKLNEGDWIGPNEYSNVPGKSSGGHLERFKHIEDVAARPLKICIGECGILVDYQARTGAITIGMSGASQAAQLLGDEMWYRGGSIPRHWFCIGGNSDWANTQVLEDGLVFLEEYYAKHPISYTPVTVTPPAQPPPLTPPYKPESIIPMGTYQITTPADYVNIHATSDLSSAIVGKLPNGSMITVTEEAKAGDDYARHIVFGVLDGWIAMQQGKVALTYIPSPPPPPAPDLISLSLAALTSIRNGIAVNNDKVRSLALQLATISDDQAVEITLLDALIKRSQNK